jgi:ribosome biogenesis GTPase
VEATITEILPRGPSLARRAPGPRGVWAQDVVVANVDLLVPVISVRDPAPGFGLLDRFLALAEIDELDAVIVASKVDLGIEDNVAARLAVYRAIGYEVIECSIRTGTGMDRLRAHVKDRLSAFVGASGVGKSSLLNVLEPGLAKAVGDISASTGKGRHTTRVGVLHTLSFGGRVADTPGLRELGLWEADQGELEWAYVEFRPYLNRCRYPDCTHVHEPGCAVREAVASGAVDVERHASYTRLLAEEEP